MKTLQPLSAVVLFRSTLFFLILSSLSACHSQDPDSSLSKANLGDPLSGFCAFPQVSPDANQSLTQFSEYAWHQFISLQWTASSTQRGQPDCSKPFQLSDEAKTWETFAVTDQLFLNNAVTPAPWNNLPLLALSETDRDYPLVTLKYRAKAPSDLNLPASIRQAVGGWLVDQNQRPTYYLVSVNEVSYDYILDNGFYNANKANQASQITFPVGSLEIKTAWKVMGKNDDQSRYYTIDAQVEIFNEQGQPTGQLTRETVGMVGMHIVFKPAALPQWSWATFEHIDNTPADKQSHAAYYNPDCQGQYCEPNQSPIQTGQPFNVPNQLTRITAIDPDVQAVNRKFSQLLTNTPFQFYELISPQWPSSPNDPGQPQGNPTPDVVANTVMESYIQPTSSCMDCHSTARTQNSAIKSDYSFLLLFANKPASSVQGE